MPNGELQGDAAAHAVAEEVCVLDLELPEEFGGVVRHLLVLKRAVDVGRVSVSLLLDGNDLAGLGKAREDLAKIDLDRGHAAVKQDQRPAGPMDLVVQVQAIYRCVAALGVLVPGHDVLLLFAKPRERGGSLS